MDDAHAKASPGRILLVGFGVLLLLGSCSSEPSLSEYAEGVEQLVLTMNFGLDSLDPLVDDPSPSLDDWQAYASGRVALREEFVEGFALLEPPSQVLDLHDTVADIMTRLVAAETAMADEVLSLEEGADISNLWDTEAGRVALEIDAEAVALCKAAEEEFDATEDQAILADVPWIPTDMKEVIRVAFYCERSDRPG